MAVLLKFILVLHSLIALSKALNTEEEFINAGLVPCISEYSPTSFADVVFDGFAANLGNCLSTKTLLKKPEITWPADSNVLSTLVMFDADGAKPPDTTIFVLWLIVNIQNNDLEAGDTIFSFLPPIALPGTGTHRYGVLVYQQDQIIDADKVSAVAENIKDLGGFLNLTKYVNENNLSSGSIAGNFFKGGCRSLF